MGVYDSTEDFEYVCIDPSCDIQQQVIGFEDCLLLDKITDWIDSAPTVIESVRKLNNPQVCSVDSQLACNDEGAGTDRWDLQQAFITAGVDVPVMNLIESDQQDIPSLQYPQILKTRLACGTVASHHMAVVSTMEELQTFRQDHAEDAVCAQDFVPHGGIIYKVFAIGSEEVRVDIRPSLGDDAIGKKFDSQNMKEVVVKETPSTDSANINMEKVKDIAGRVDKKLGLGLFGLDIIIGSNDRKYYVVDVNYYPTFKGVNGLSELMRDLLLKKMN
ncbi:hypothetical protein FOL47_008627 [Perkinsus chesapeaki]|uniref:ATP-grasp domain-containing protein n=1 Tax=Perkinsus chesapeaki TaxID=330153 RepID=A0A7J6LDI2_PERCH|nr:hypothetical protein FOL47_008627 [Perkinsus chesapeaki]